jgi:putative transmembrane protein
MRDMKKNFLVRAFFGVTIVALGGVLLLRNLEIIKFDSWNVFWGTVWAAGLVLAGLVTIVSSQRLLTRAWGLLLMAAGVSVGLNAYGVIDVSIWKLFWPVVLITVGLMMVFSIGSGNHKQTKKSGDDDNEKVAIFYGEESRVRGDYTGGSLTAVFGGVELDLRQANIKDGAIIDVFTFCGGININLPDDVIVKNEVRGVLGGSDDKTVPKPSAKKTIYLRGECVLGGLEIK